MTLPEVRQNQDPESPYFGSVAVRGAENRWGVMHPVHGGYWTIDSEVTEWAVLS